MKGFATITSISILVAPKPRGFAGTLDLAVLHMSSEAEDTQAERQSTIDYNT